MASKYQQKKDDLDDQLNHITNSSSSNDMKKYLVDSDEDLPGFGEVELYDYNKDMEKAKQTGKKLLGDLVDLYLGDSEIAEHPYIKSRMDEDAEYYSQMKIVQKLSEKLLLQQMKQIDAGDIAPRMYEITSKHIGEIRENIKDGRNARLEIEKMYKEMRKDLGLNETVQSEKYNVEEDEDAGIIMNSSTINSQIEDYIKNREDKKD